ncbi:NAD(P)-dependent alcohol dehydrogenase [Cohnella sp. GCM10027633]|uniref:NAD(P)-dependent alcohol dehydrogenase n=1 Tax=unclassified Cohnella TaxID=2636738 RepID=UPI00363A428F
MKAMLCTKYGPPEVLRLREVKKPIPGPRDILVRVHATTVTSGDCRVRGFRSPPLFWLPMRIVLGFTKPRKPILGVELAGEVEAVGRAVKLFKPGDRVFAMTGFRFGAHAEYALLSEGGAIASLSDGVSYEEAASIPFGGTTALHFLRKGIIREGDKVLIYGASGAVGTAAVQLAKHFGATVTGVCSAANAELVRSLGADDVIDHTSEDFTARSERYDLVFDAVGKTTKAACRGVLAPNGRYVTVEGLDVAKELASDLEFLQSLLAAGKYKAVIDRRYPLEGIPDAHRYVEQGRKRGNVVITVAHVIE